MTDYQIAMEGLTSSIKDPELLIKSFKKNLYPDGFQKFYLSLVPALDAVEKLYLSVGEPDTMLGNMAQSFAAEAKDHYDRTPKRSREVFFINQSLAVAGYVFPAILQYNGKCSVPLIEHIRKEWKECFPKSNIKSAPYEDIEKGFHRKWCYITTAACQVRGMDDDCEELNLLRAYRDTYMAGQSGGEDLILKYYDIAPSIVKHINLRPDSAQIYDRLWEKYIGPCIIAIREGRMEDCLSLYRQMVLDTKEKYFHLYPHVKQTNR